jgi:hypothetical protein
MTPLGGDDLYQVCLADLPDGFYFRRGIPIGRLCSDNINNESGFHKSHLLSSFIQSRRGFSIGSQKKSPSILKQIEGLHPVYLTLFTESATPLSLRKGTAVFSGRSSDSPAFLAAFPFRIAGTVAIVAKKVPFLLKVGITAAGPLPIFTGFPIKPFAGT